MMPVRAGIRTRPILIPAALIECVGDSNKGFDRTKRKPCDESLLKLAKS
jgi:hypothetical protein